MNLINRIFFKLLNIWWKLTIPLRLRAKGVEVGKGACFYGMPIISMAPNSHIRLGDRVVLCSDSRFTALGVNHPVVLRTLRPNAEIVIGNDSGISGGSICAASQIILGKECLIGANVTIADTDFHAINPKNRRYNNNQSEIDTKPICIQNNIFIGTGSLILKGVNIGENCVIGAMSVVTKDVPRNSIYAGSPAKLIQSDIGN